MSYYFDKHTDVKSKEVITRTDISGRTYIFKTDNNVFSKKGLDFGTRTLLDNLPLEKINGDVLDFGCGYGPIGIFVKSNTEARVDMVDINERALNLARVNAKLNGVDVSVFESNIYENIDKKYDYIISNPPIRVGKEILYKILFGAKGYLKQFGELWIVVNKDQGAKTVAKELEKEYEVSIVEKNKGFYVICARNN
ncbi:MAG: class I SAM-dependent methyltransferase [Firmicutes bacterium]|nr:class I SAM-dependent methyltransferase [Bacillota bacterium]